jgi:exodeoxyribonuclease V alpha subunit
VDYVVSLSKKRIPKAYGADAIDDIQVITPTKKGVSGTKNLNAVLQNALNPNINLQEKHYKDNIFRLGDKVMQIRNNYDLEWVKISDNTYGNGIFNGDVGRIVAINTKEEVLSVMYDDKIADYTFEDLDDLELAYAITVHKSQGSEFRIVILPLLCGPRQLLNREILYTAVTRAKELLIIVGNSKTINSMVNNKRHSSRYSMLNNMIRMCIGI